MSNFKDYCKKAVLYSLDFPMSAYPSSSKQKEHMEQVYKTLNVESYIENSKAFITSTESSLTDKCWEVEYHADTGRYFINRYLRTNCCMMEKYGVETM